MYVLQLPLRWFSAISLILLCFSCQIEDQLEEFESILEEEISNSNQFELEEFTTSFENFRLGNWNMLYEETFEGDESFYCYVTKQFAENHSFQTVTNPTFKGKKVGRFELRKNDAMATRTGKRAEVLFGRPKNKDNWYSFAVNFPANGFEKDNDDELISQWHNSGTPTVSLRVINDRFVFRIGHDSAIRTALWDSYDFGSIPKDVWLQFVFHIIHSDGQDGLVEVWRNGTKIITHIGPNMYSGSQIPRWKVGIYKNTWEKRSTDTDIRILYFDNIRIGNENATFDEMNPSVDNDLGWGPYIPDIESFTLINTITNQAIGIVPNNGTINIKPLNDNRISLRANFKDSFNGSVDFVLAGPKNYNFIDHSPPYALYGVSSDGQYYNQGGTPAGKYSLKATPYAERNKNGKVGNLYEYYFKIVEEDNNNIIYDHTNIESINSVPDQFLAGYWKMDESSGSTLFDISGNGNNAKILNSSGVEKVKGKVGLSLSLNGRINRYAEVPHNPTLDITESITIAAWIKPNGIARKQIISKGGNDGFEFSIFENGKVEFRINRESNGSSYRLNSIKNYPTDGETWMHVAVTFDGTKSTIYINGLADNFAIYNPTKINSNSTSLQIGARDGINRWEGALDEVRLYSKALSASEILSLTK